MDWTRVKEYMYCVECNAPFLLTKDGLILGAHYSDCDEWQYALCLARTVDKIEEVKSNFP